MFMSQYYTASCYLLYVVSNFQLFGIGVKFGFLLWGKNVNYK